jgi:cell division protein FtsW (lipid II flippase)
MDRPRSLTEHPRMSPALLLSHLPALLVGLWVMRAAGVSPSLLALQAVAGLVALGLAAALSRASSEAVRARAPWALVAGLLLAALTLASSGMDGVHRWVSLGPVRLHASSLASPAVLVGAAAWLHAGRTVQAAAALLALQALHVLQPDAGQATAFGAGGLVLLVAALQERKGAGAALAAVGLGVGAVAAWTRPDPLGAVPHVERIVQLAWAQHAALGLAAVAALVILVLAPAGAAVRMRRNYAVCGALAAYVLGTVVVPLLGDFPVPVMGFGVSPVLGIWLGVGVVAAVARSART